MISLEQLTKPLLFELKLLKKNHYACHSQLYQIQFDKIKLFHRQASMSVCRRHRGLRSVNNSGAQSAHAASLLMTHASRGHQYLRCPYRHQHHHRLLLFNLWIKIR
jgi:uncharacterized protein YxeA